MNAPIHENVSTSVSSIIVTFAITCTAFNLYVLAFSSKSNFCMLACCIHELLGYRFSSCPSLSPRNQATSPWRYAWNVCDRKAYWAMWFCSCKVSLWFRLVPVCLILCHVSQARLDQVYEASQSVLKTYRTQKSCFLSGTERSVSPFRIPIMVCMHGHCLF